MMKFSKIVLPALVALVLAAPQAVQAQQPQGMPDPLGIYKQIGCKPDQLNQITTIHKEFEGLYKTAQSRIAENQKKMQDLSMTPLPDEKATLATNDQLNQLIAEVNTAHVKMMLKVRKVLTPDQRSKVVDELKKHQPPMR